MVLGIAGGAYGIIWGAVGVGKVVDPSHDYRPAILLGRSNTFEGSGHTVERIASASCFVLPGSNAVQHESDTIGFCAVVESVHRHHTVSLHKSSGMGYAFKWISRDLRIQFQFEYVPTFGWGFFNESGPYFSRVVRRYMIAAAIL